MDISELSPKQLEAVICLCDILALQDTSVAIAVLSSYNWNLEKAVNEIQDSKSSASPKLFQPLPTKFESPFKNQDEYDDQADENQYEYPADESHNFEQPGMYTYTKEIFDEAHPSCLLPLTKGLSESSGGSFQQKIVAERKKKMNSRNYHEEYMMNLMNNSEVICQQLLQGDTEESNKYLTSTRKTVANKKFIEFLEKSYRPKMNFTFGTFFLNLTRTYLDQKVLLVYIHSHTLEEAHYLNRVVQMTLSQTEIAKFTHKHCLCYGMFDNSDDYEVLQKYVPLKSLPAFALFRLDCKTRREKFISSFQLAKQNNMLEWLAENIGVSIKKKPVKPAEATLPEALAPSKSMEHRHKIADIVQQQNAAFQELESKYKLRRQVSTDRKENLMMLQDQLTKEKAKFLQLPEPAMSATVIEIKFRMPLSGSCRTYKFECGDKIDRIFLFVHCCCRDEFEDQWNDFDLTQSFPYKSLRESRHLSIHQVFDGSQRENLIVKEL